MRPSKAPGYWASNRWLEQIHRIYTQPDMRIPDYRGESDIIYDNDSREFWENVTSVACHFAQEALAKIIPSEKAAALNYKVIDKRAVNQIAHWKEELEPLREKRHPGKYCRPRHYPAEGVLDRITGDLDVKLAGYNPNPTEEDILDHLTFGFGMPSPATIETIRKHSDSYSSLGFCLWQDDKLLGMVAGNATHRNYGRDHIALELIQKAPSWRKDGGWAIEALGLPALIVAHLVGKGTIILSGADDPEGFHRLMLRRGFEFRMAYNPQGYGSTGVLVAKVEDLVKPYGIELPPPMVPTRIGFDIRGNLQPIKTSPSP